MPERPSSAGTQENEPPLVGEVFARRLREARNARRWTQQDLVGRLAELDAAMDRTVLARIEKGQRDVRLEEAVALAAALDVALVNLILPIEGDRLHQPVDESLKPLRGRAKRRGPLVRLTKGLAVNQVKARRWARGELPLDPANFRSYRDQTADLTVSDEELPAAERSAIREENLREMRKRGMLDPAPAELSPTKSGRRRRSAGEEQQ